MRRGAWAQGPVRWGAAGPSAECVGAGLTEWDVFRGGVPTNAHSPPGPRAGGRPRPPPGSSRRVGTCFARFPRGQSASSESLIWWGPESLGRRHHNAMRPWRAIAYGPPRGGGGGWHKASVSGGGGDLGLWSAAADPPTSEKLSSGKKWNLRKRPEMGVHELLFGVGPSHPPGGGGRGTKEWPESGRVAALACAFLRGGLPTRGGGPPCERGPARGAPAAGMAYDGGVWPMAQGCTADGPEGAPILQSEGPGPQPPPPQPRPGSRLPGQWGWGCSRLLQRRICVVGTR